MAKLIKTYNSVAALAATLEGEPLKNNSISTKSAKALFDFAGVSTIAEAKTLLEDGDANAAAKIKAAGDIVAPPKDSKPQLRNSVVGCLPNVPNYLKGVPTAMYQIHTTARKKPVVDIYVEATIYDGIDEKALASKCNMLANAIAATELAGYRVNLFAVCLTQSNKRSRNMCGLCVNIKEADAPLNLLNIAFPLTNKAFCRAIYLRWIDVNANFDASGKYSYYGNTCSTSEIKNAFNVNGLLLSMRDLVRYDTKQSELEKQINDYLNTF